MIVSLNEFKRDIQTTGKIFCLLGESCSGKDTMFKELMCGFGSTVLPILTYTDRPMRAGEENGKEYTFVTKDEMDILIEKGNMIEVRSYTVVDGEIWRYGLFDNGYINLDEHNYIIISTPESYESLAKHFGKDIVYPIYIKVPDEERIMRAIERTKSLGNTDFRYMCLRYLDDYRDFQDINNNSDYRKEINLKVIDNRSTIYECSRIIAKYIIEVCNESCSTR